MILSFSTLLLIILVCLKIEIFFKFSFNILKYFIFSTKVTFFAPLEIHSKPNDPTPE